jgi:hypothetical protein
MGGCTAAMVGGTARRIGSTVGSVSGLWSFTLLWSILRMNAKQKQRILKSLTITLHKLERDPWACNQDRWSYERAIAYLKAGKITRAAAILDDLDTCARDRMAEFVWEWVLQSTTEGRT